VTPGIAHSPPADRPLRPIHEAQLLTYLRLGGWTVEPPVLGVAARGSVPLSGNAGGPEQVDARRASDAMVRAAGKREPEWSAMTGGAAFDRITFEPGKMGGRACIRGLRITVSTIVGLVAEGETTAAILEAYPDLEPEDIRQALAYAAWLTREEVMPA
jgi:uncharacterized protein (DUF433 family)